VPHNGLEIKRITCPIGKILIIYESRPNVTLDAFALCFKSGNACILRGGSESFRTSSKIVEIIHKTFDDENLSAHKNLVEYVQTTDRTAMVELLKKHDEINLVIPRGGKNLVEFVASNTTIPILKHLDGNCHTYIEKTANPQKAIEVLRNAKLRRVSICGATESLVIDEFFAKEHLPHIINAMPECEFVGCKQSMMIDNRVKPATDGDFYTEFLAPKLSVKIVNGIDEAILFINKYSSKHTEAILSENSDAVQKFFVEIDSANIMHNVSTQFADGYEFGLGAEIGIATGKLHARGPVGLQELVTYRNIVSANSYTVRL
jgi:glutamate-5-semialdehyde dehydrogenase